MTTSELDVRYGRTPGRGLRRRVVAVAAAIATAAVLTAWLLWAGLLAPTATLDARDVGFVIASDDEIVLRFEVSATPGTTARCALEAQNEQHAIVGWKVIELPPSESFTRQYEELIVTSEPAVIGLISTCRLT